MDASNPYAPPRADVRDVADPSFALTLADRGTRLAASLLDGVIFAGMVYVPLLLAAGIGGAASSAGAPPGDETALVAIALAATCAGFVAWLWLTLRYMHRNGQSIAKKLLGIKVVRSDGTPVSLGRLVWLRNVVNWVVSIVPLYGIIDSLFIFSEPRQCLHDRIADTIVVNA
jgi:uncharacterized RDD family membrane protein YckC